MTPRVTTTDLVDTGIQFTPRSIEKRVAKLPARQMVDMATQQSARAALLDMATEQTPRPLLVERESQISPPPRLLATAATQMTDRLEATPRITHAFPINFISKMNNETQMSARQMPIG